MVTHHSDQTVGTLGGTLLTIIGVLDTGDIIKTCVLAGIGAIVSFGVSKLMQWLWPTEKGRSKPQ